MKKSFQINTGLLLMIWPILLVLSLWGGIPYGTWDYGLSFSASGTDNIISSEINKILDGEFLGWEVLYWIVIRFFNFFFGKYGSIVYICLLTTVSMFSLYSFLRSFFNDKERIDCVIFSTLLVANPFVVTRIVAGHLPIYTSIVSMYLLLWALYSKSKFSFIFIVFGVVFSGVSPYGSIFLLLIGLISWVLKPYGAQKLTLVGIVLFITNCLAFGKLFGTYTLKKEFAKATNETSELVYAPDFISERLIHAKITSLSVLELLGAPLREGLDIIYAFPSAGFFGEFMFFLINIYLVYTIFISLRCKSKPQLFVLLCIFCLCSIWNNPLGINLLSGLSYRFPNIISALSTPSRFLFVLFAYKLLLAIPHIQIRCHYTFKVLGLFFVALCFTPRIASPSDYDKDQPLAIDLTSKDYSSIISDYKARDIYIFPNAYWYKLQRNGNYLPWTSREYSPNFKKYYYESKALNKTLCDRDFNGLKNFLLNNPNAVFVISRFEYGVSYDGGCIYNLELYEHIAAYFRSQQGISLQYAGSDFVIFGKE